MLDVLKAIQESDIPVKLTKANENFIEEAIRLHFSKLLENGSFPNSTHLRQNFLYSESANKNPAYLFVLSYLNVFLIYQYHYLSNKKNIEPKNKNLMMSLSL